MDFGVRRQAQVRLDDHAAGAVEGRAGSLGQHLAQPRCPHAGRPQHGAGGDAPLVAAGPDGDALGVDAGNPGAGE
jgi:hypothetical protein